jgi:hypothetical protein
MPLSVLFATSGIVPGADPGAAGAGMPGGVARRVCGAASGGDIGTSGAGGGCDALGGVGGIGLGGIEPGARVPIPGAGRGTGGGSFLVGATGSIVERAARSSSDGAPPSGSGIFITGICIVRTSPFGPRSPRPTGAYGRVSPGRFDGERACGATAVRAVRSHHRHVARSEHRARFRLDAVDVAVEHEPTLSGKLGEIAMHRVVGNVLLEEHDRVPERV